jgi:uncharacterized protein YoxC
MMKKERFCNEGLYVCDKLKNEKYLINSTEEANEISCLLNQLNEDIEKEKEKYSQLFEKFWDYKKKLNQISNVMYRYDNKIDEKGDYYE